ncbi:M15 family metallopeptidase [Luteimicrobium sp. NPDC057192]|uniref:M15 family metallopeptidase n=1 Tax=Luteimicrobium sp. NPDC057192 TaxID=3346042 RepID=UPI003639CF36
MTTTGRQRPAPPHVARAPRPAAVRRAEAAARARDRRRARRRRTFLVAGVVVLLLAAAAAAVPALLGRDSGGAPEAAPTAAVASRPTPTPTPTPTARERAAATITAAWTDRWRGSAGFLGKAKGPASCAGSVADPTRCTQAYAGGTLVWRPAKDAAVPGRGGTVTVAQTGDPGTDLVIVNKKRPLDPKTFSPKKLVAVAGPAEVMRPEAASALRAMFRGASKAGLPLAVHSAYRAYEVQASTYEGWVAAHGKKQADNESARPGYSEHQTGLGVDVVASTGSCTAMGCFGSTDQAAWVAKNGWRYGFVVRYPKGQEKTTGYMYEPWHVRYVGKKVAADVRATGAKTLEDFFGLPAARTY